MIDLRDAQIFLVIKAYFIDKFWGGEEKLKNRIVAATISWIYSHGTQNVKSNLLDRYTEKKHSFLFD